MDKRSTTLARIAGATAITVLAIAVGLTIGYLYNQVSRHLEVALLFPVLAGLLSGAVVAVAAQTIHSTRVVVVAGLLAGGLAYSSSFYYDYHEFRADLAHIAPTGVTVSAAQLDAMEQRLLGGTGLAPYLSARAQNGLSTPSGTHASALIQGDAEWLLWGGEILLAAGAGGYMARTRRYPQAAAGALPFRRAA